MSEAKHAPASPKHEHGTTRSYIIGFVLSLIFTIIPYLMVVNKMVTGNALLISILGIAVLQMFIQIFFFLHLGRGPKPFYNVVFFFGTAGIIMIVISASLFIMSNLYRNMLPNEVTRKLAQDESISEISGKETGACDQNLKNHIVTIRDGIIDPSHIEAKRCDTLTLLNKDKTDYTIAFGIHPQDISYGGMDEVVIDDKRPETITLNQTGNFFFHDHQGSSIIGHFFVTP